MSIQKIAVKKAKYVIICIGEVKHMSETIKVFHGSSQPVIKPDLAYCSKYSDFGRGFYVTKNRGQAIEWGAKRSKGSTFAVSCFDLTLDNSLSVKVFSKPDKEWLDLVLKGRNGGTLPYDIIIGPVADDNVRKAINVYENFCFSMNGKKLSDSDNIFFEQFKTKVIEMLEVKDNYSQIALLNNRALEFLRYKSFALYDSKTREVLKKTNNYKPLNKKKNRKDSHDF